MSFPVRPESPPPPPVAKPKKAFQPRTKHGVKPNVHGMNNLFEHLKKQHIAQAKAGKPQPKRRLNTTVALEGLVGTGAVLDHAQSLTRIFNVLKQKTRDDVKKAATSGGESKSSDDPVDLLFSLMVDAFGRITDDASPSLVTGPGQLRREHVMSTLKGMATEGAERAIELAQHGAIDFILDALDLDIEEETRAAIDTIASESTKVCCAWFRKR